MFKREWLSIDTKADCCLEEEEDIFIPFFFVFLNLPPSPIDRSRLSSYIWLLVCLTQIQFRLDSLLISLLNRERKSLFLFPVNTWARDLNSSGLGRLQSIKILLKKHLIIIFTFLLLLGGRNAIFFSLGSQKRKEKKKDCRKII